MAEFSESIDYCLANEGGLVDNRNDNGGITNFGITLPMLNSYRQKQCSNSDIINLTQGEAKQLYQSIFWDKLRISGLKQPIATAILDCAINHGQGTAIRLAQECLPHINPDAVLGPESLEALDKCNVEMFIYNYVGLLQDRFVTICINTPNQMVFLRGWLARSRRLFTLMDSMP